MITNKRGEWPKVIGETCRLLKPGGWIQLGEYGFWGFGSGFAEDHAFGLYYRLCNQVSTDFHVFAELPNMMRQAGFRNVQVERHTGRYPVRDQKES